MKTHTSDNIILAKNKSLPKDAPNKNILVIGGPGSGKTRNFVKANLLQMHGSYVVSDFKVEVQSDVGTALKHGGYDIKMFNVLDVSNSMKYNPFSYLHGENDIAEFVDMLIANTKGDDGSDYFVNIEKLLLHSYIGFICSEFSENERNLTSLFNMLKTAAGRVSVKAAASCYTRLAPFDTAEMRKLTEYDEMNLGTAGKKKTAIFIENSWQSERLRFLTAVMYSQLYKLLYENKPSIPVRFFLDNFSDIGEIPKLEKYTAIFRANEVSTAIIVQALSQLEYFHKDAAEVIVGNCDTVLFLGCRERETVKFMSELTGFSENEIAFKSSNNCIVRTLNDTAYCDKYDLANHPNYKLTAGV